MSRKSEQKTVLSLGKRRFHLVWAIAAAIVFAMTAPAQDNVPVSSNTAPLAPAATPPAAAVKTPGHIQGAPGLPAETAAKNAAAAPKPNTPPEVTATPVADLPEKWGIEVVSLRRTAANYMLDFRYRVLDPEKAASLFDEKNAAWLTDEKSGAKFAVPAPPKVGALRMVRKPKAGVICYMLFANPGQYVQQGAKVTVTVGDIKIEHLTVE